MAVITGLDTGTHTDWSPTKIKREILRFRQAKLVLSSRVDRHDEDVLSEGQALKIPYETELNTNPVGADRTYTPQADTGASYTLNITLFREASFSIGVDADAQSAAVRMLKGSRRTGYALGKYLEDQLWSTADNAAVTQTNNITTAMVDRDWRRLAQYLEDADAMEEGDIYVAMAPADKNDLIAIDKFANVQFTGKPKGAATTGEAPNVYGMVPLISTRAGVDSNGRRRILAFQEEGIGMATQKKVPLAIEKHALKTDYVGWVLAGMARQRLTHLAFARVG